MTSKVTMPEPVAWRSKYKSEPGMIGQYPWSYVERSLRQPALNNYDIEALITTTQAEAYADARVRVALEEALIEVMRCKTSGIIRNDTVDKCADAIRALIPKEPPCET